MVSYVQRKLNKNRTNKYNSPSLGCLSFVYFLSTRLFWAVVSNQQLHMIVHTCYLQIMIYLRLIISPKVVVLKIKIIIRLVKLQIRFTLFSQKLNKRLRQLSINAIETVLFRSTRVGNGCLFGGCSELMFN